MIGLHTLLRRAALKVPQIRRLMDRISDAEARAAEAERRASEAIALADERSAEVAAIAQTVTETEEECAALTSLLVAAERERDLLVTTLRDREGLENVLSDLCALEGQTFSGLQTLEDHVQDAVRDHVQGLENRFLHPTLSGLQALEQSVHAVLQSRSSSKSELQICQVLAGVGELNLRLSGRSCSGRGTAGLQASNPAATRYLDLLEDALTGVLYQDSTVSPWSSGYDPKVRALGRDWPEHAETMIGSARMRNLRLICERELAEGVPGDFIETGVWRGGACIYMRAILEAYGDKARRVFVADSFQGLPPPDESTFPADSGDPHHTFEQLVVSRAEVEANFRKYGLLDERAIFLEGWFKDTLPTAPIQELAVLRLDGDMYESTIQALEALYHKVSPGGFVIIDDYILKPCAQAVDDFRSQHGIAAQIEQVDGAAVWWRKSG